MFAPEPLLAAAHIEQDGEFQREVSGTAKELHRLHDAVLENFDFIAGEVCDQPALRITGGEGDIYESDINFYSGWNRVLRKKLR